jgi:hypothetical protein
MTAMTSYPVLQQNCGFSAVEFTRFRAIFEKQMREPKNRIGIEGPGRHGVVQQTSAWEDWLDLFVDSGIGSQFWGLGTDRKWSFPADRAEYVKLPTALGSHERRAEI